MIALLLLAQAPVADLMMTRAHDGIAPPRCPVQAEPDEVQVCGLRRADRFRVPFVVADPGDPAHEGVMAERTRLLHRTTPLADLSPFQVGGGMVGVSAGIGGGKGAQVAGWRPLAP